MEGIALAMHTRSTYWMTASATAKTITQCRVRVGRTAPSPKRFRLVALAEVAHQLREGRFHLVLHLADELVLAHADMVERL